MSLVERAEELLKKEKNDPNAKLNSFQVKAISLIEQRNDNIIAIGPTGIGKTLIGISAILYHGRGFYLAPLRALMREKYVEFRRLFPDKRVVLTNKDYSLPRKVLKDADIRVLSPYKFIIYLDYLDPSDGVVVVDEIHKINEDPEMEAAVSAIKAMGFRIIALSATVHEEDIPKMSRWLSATSVVADDERPVPLRFTEVKFQLTPKGLVVEKGGGYLEQYKDKVYPNKYEAIADLVKTLRQRDPSGNIMVWTPTRSEADTIAKIISLKLPTVLPGASKHVIKSGEHDEALAAVIEKGVGIHHGGISAKNKELVEDLFYEKKIHTVVTCYTLSHGVNFPVRYLIVSSLTDYDSKPLDPSTFHQLAGRAGRPGLDSFGEVIVITIGDLESYLLTKILSEKSTRIKSKLYNKWMLTKMAAQRIALDRSLDSFVRFLKETYYVQEHGPRGLDELKKLGEEAVAEAAEAYFLVEGSRIYAKGRNEYIAALMGLHPKEWAVHEPMVRGDYQNTVLKAATASLDATEVGDRSVVDKVLEYGLLGVYLGSWKVRDVAEYTQTILDAVGVYVRRVYGWHSQEFANAKKINEMFIYGGNPNAKYLSEVLKHDELKRVVRNMPQVIVDPEDIDDATALNYVGMLVDLIFEFKKRIYMKRVMKIVDALLKTIYGEDVPSSVHLRAVEVAKEHVAKIAREMKVKVIP